MMMVDENEGAAHGAKPAKAAKGGSKKAGALGARTINGRTVEETYQKKTQLEHILLRPDTYVGSCDRVAQPMWIYSEAEDKMVRRSVTFTPGLYKIFDEIVVNAADNKQRDSKMDRLEVTIDAESGTLSVWNNGRGVPIAVHQKHDCYVPELIFGNLLTGSNFDDEEKKTTGGRNGYGAKLANIFSTEFTVETADRSVKQKYKQTFTDNMQTKGEPVIKPYTGEDFTCITFKPDWGRFKMEGLDADTAALLSKRVYDLAACMGMSEGERVKVSLNGRKLPVKRFKDYLSMFEGLEAPVVFEKLGGGRWEVGVAPSDGAFQQVSYVNAICTIKGGSHVMAIADQVAAGLAKAVAKRNNKEEVKGLHIKNHIAVYVNALVENPAFDSQTKETLTTRPSDFGSVPQLSAEAIKALEKSPIVDAVVSWAKFKQTQQLGRKSGKKAVKLTGVPKLDDANLAGTARSQECTLILTEGDSAKTLAVSGLGVVGRDLFGVFPLKGKLLNVRDTSMKLVSNNEEISNIVQIMGLKYGMEYQDTKSLRYGHLMIMTDQDHDGSHIKGLLINFVHHFWPSLLRIPGFLQEFITPIVKATRGSREERFYTIPDFEEWKLANNDGKGWTTKYYKGLGTSTAKEAKEYFAAIDIHLLDFSWEDDRKDADLIDMAFSKKRAEDRKRWLAAVKPGTSVRYDVEAMTYNSFINEELVLFSAADTQRSIPSLVDGLKPSQRKVLFGCFKRKLTSEVKVAQLAGYVSEHAAYHHGEASLNTTIVGMAQTFVGSNNLHLLSPGGQFGTRLMGGKDAASTRYIFTRQEKLTRAVFHPDDDALLSHLEDDGTPIEPTYYVPVLPMVLVNGSQGIGTGWSSDVPNFCPRDVVQNLRRMLNNQPMVLMQPWYRGYTGTIEQKVTRKVTEPSYVSRGIIKRVNPDQVLITELPLKKWTQDYKQFLETLLPGHEVAAEKGAPKWAKGKKAAPTKAGAAAKAKKGKKAAEEGGDEEGDGAKDKEARPRYNIKDFRENHTDTTVSFLVTMAEENLDAIEGTAGGLCKFFKLEGSLNTSNMMLFDQEGHIRKYSSPLQIIEDFFALRLDFYGRRKRHLLGRLQHEWRRLDNRVRFVLAVVEKRLEVSNRRRDELLAELVSRGFDSMAPEGTAQADDDSGGNALVRGYEYLLGMKLWSLTLEKVRQLEAELDAKSRELEALRATSPEQLWLRDLDVIEALLDESDAAFARDALLEQKQRGKALANQKGGAGGAKARGVKARAAAAAKRRRANGGGSGGGGSNSGAESGEDSDFENAGKKRGGGAAKKGKGAAAAAGPPMPDAGPVAAALGLTTDGVRVSAAFAVAEAAGQTVGSSAELPYVNKAGAAGAEEVAAGNNEDGEADDVLLLAEPAGHWVPPVVEKKGMSLAERCKMRTGGTGISDDEKPKPAKGAKGKAAAPKAAAAGGGKAAAPARKKKEKVVNSDDDESADDASSEDSDDGAAAAAARRAAMPRRGAAAAAAKSFKRSGDEEEEGEEGDEDEESEAESEEAEDEDEFEDEDGNAKRGKSKAAAKPPPAAVAAVKPPAAAKKAAKPAAPKKAAAAKPKKKAAVVDLASDDDVSDAGGGGRNDPFDLEDCDGEDDFVAAKPKPRAKAPAAASKGVKRQAKGGGTSDGSEPPLKKALVSKPKAKKAARVVDSDEDSDVEMGGSQASAAAAKPAAPRSRRGQAVSYAAMAGSDAEDGSEGEESAAGGDSDSD